MHVCGNFWVHVCRFWVHVYKTCGCMYAETVGCKVCGCWVHVYRAVGCMPDCLCLPDRRQLHSPRVSSSLGPGAPRGPGPKPSNKQTIEQTIKQSNNETMKQSNLYAWESYLQSGKQRTVVRQAKESQASRRPLSGKPRTVRQAKDSCQAKHRQSGKHPSVPQTCTQHPHTLHPSVSAYVHPNVFFYRHAPKFRIYAPKSFRIHAFNSACILK